MTDIAKLIDTKLKADETWLNNKKLPTLISLSYTN